MDKKDKPYSTKTTEPVLIGEMLEKSARHAAITFCVLSVSLLFSIVFVMGDGSAPFFTHAVLFITSFPIWIFTMSPMANPWAGIFIWSLLVLVVEFFIALARAK